MGESQHLEWKTSWRDEYLKWVCGFANSEGGVLVVGRDDEGRVVGVPDTQRLLEELPNKARDLLGVVIDVKVRAVDGRETLEIGVEAYPNPISYRGEYYYRSGSTNQMLKGAALDRFLMRKHGRTWDSVPLPGVMVNDLDARSLKTFRQLAARSQRLPEVVLAESERALLEKLRLMEGDYPTRAAALVFHPEPQRFFGGASVKIGAFEDGVGLRYQDEIEGGLLAQVEQTIEVLRAKYLRAWITYEGLLRVETWPIPMPALREAVLNAVIHKDYASGIPIQIRVYPHKLMIWNPGELPPSWDLGKLLGQHASIPYNPGVAGVFFRTGMIESWGQGIERIMAACRTAKTPAPVVEVEPSGIWITFPYPDEKAAPATTQEAPATTQEAPATTQEAPATTPNTTTQMILAMLREDPELTRETMATRLGLTPDGVKYHLNKLKQAGRLQRIGSTKKGRWQVLGGEDE